MSASKRPGSTGASSKCPGTTLWQLFVYDPSGVQLELTFEGAIEGDEGPDLSPGRVYVPGASFFKPATYPKLLEPA